MEWTQALTIIASMFGMMLWSARERRGDYLYTMRIIEEIKNEMRDFHARLCVIEERNKK